MNMHAKCDVSTSNRSRDMEGGPKISKVAHVTLFRPVNEGLPVTQKPIFRFPDPDLPIHYTIQLSLGYDGD